jgi:inositol 1,4,5-triphosphate receptor type 1
MPIHESETNFERFGMYVLFNVSFFIFITTIGLNIIFGIIVDTFSELRDLKVSPMDLSLKSIGYLD